MHHRPRSLPVFVQSVGFVRGCPIRVMPTALPVPVPVPAAITTATSSFVPRARPASWPRSRSVSSGIFTRSVSVAIAVLVTGSGPSVGAYRGRSGTASTTLASLLERRAVPRGPTAPMMIDARRGRTSRTDSALVVVVWRAVTCAIHRRRRRSRWRFGIRPGAAFVPLWVHHDAGPKDRRTDTYKDRNCLPWVTQLIPDLRAFIWLGLFKCAFARERERDRETDGLRAREYNVVW